MELTDGHVVLRTPTEDDAATVAASVRFSVASLTPWMPWASPDYDEATALQWITGEIEGPDAVRFLIFDLDGRHLGTIGLNAFDTRNDLANLGYWLRPDATGAGYATRATRLLADYGLRHLGLHRIEVMMSVENEPSRRVAERAGAHYEGVLRGRLKYGNRYHDAHIFCFMAGD